MRRLLFLLPLLVVAFAVPKSAHALDTAFTISSFDSQVTIQKDGTLSVVETIDTVFSQSKHGIFRDLPYAYKNADGTTKYTNIEVQSVTDNGLATPFTVAINNANERIQIGDANVLVTGSQKYVISYTVTGILYATASADELDWNITGDQWDVSIAKATATVTLPAPRFLGTTCYQGGHGSKETCTLSQFDASSTTITAASTRTLSPGEGMTVYATYTQGLVPILTGTKPAGVPGSHNPLAVGIAALAILALFVLKILSIHRRRIQAEGSGNNTIMAVYDPPNGLRPGELSYLMTQSGSVDQVTATIVDLAVRGYLTITEIPKQGAFGSTDYTLHRTDKAAGDELLEYEKLVLSTLFAGGAVDVTLSSLKNTYYTALTVIKEAIEKECEKKGFFSADEVKGNKTYLSLGIVGAVFLGFAFWFGWNAIPASTAADAILGILLGMTVGSFFFSLAAATYFSARTPQGHQVYLQAMGYKLFLSETEKYRQPFFERQNMFMDILPYAIVFGVTKKLAQAFQQMNVQPPAPNWYVGMTAFNMASFTSNLDTFSHSLSSSMASSPGGSGGGSGGGGGGGGGGSW